MKKVSFKQIRLLLLFIGALMVGGHNLNAQSYAFTKEISGLTQSFQQFDFYGPRDIEVDVNGNIFITDRYRSNVAKYVNSGGFVKAWGRREVTSDAPDLIDPVGISSDVSGNIYVLDAGSHRVVKYSNNGAFITQWPTYSTGYASKGVLYGIDIAPNGNIYISEDQSVKIFSPQGKYIKTFGTALLSYIGQIEVDANYNIYIASYSGIGKINSSGAYTQIASTGTGNGQVSGASDLKIDIYGNLYIIETTGHRVQILSTTGTYIKKFGVMGTNDGEFSMPEGITVDDNGIIYVTDVQARNIQRFNFAGTFISKMSSPTGTTLMHDPAGMAVNNNGDVFVADRQKNRVVKYNSLGQYVSSIGSVGSGDGEFQFPSDIAISSNGDLIVVDQYNHRIQRFNSSGIYLSQFGTAGTGDGEFGYPASIVIDASGNLLITDSENGRVQLFDNSGQFISAFGSFGTGDGQLRYPEQISLDADGNIYVADYGNSRVVRFNSAGSFLNNIGDGFGENTQASGVLVDQNNTVHIVSESGRIKTYAVDGTALGSWAVGNFTLSRGWYIRSTAPGYVYLSESTNRISVFQPIPQLLITVDNGTTIQEVEMLGTVDFGALTFEVPSDIYTFTITNKQPGSTLHIGNLVTGGINQSFFPMDKSSLVSTLPYGASTTFQIHCIPALPGNLIAEVIINSDYLNASPFTFTLTASTPKADPVISITSIPDKTYGDGPFTVSASSTNSMTGLTYTPGPYLSVFSGTTYSITGTGQTYVTVSQPENAYYNSASATYTFMINKAPLQVIANDFTRPEGQPNPTFTYSYAGFVYGQNQTVLGGFQPSLSTLATTSSIAGDYDITVDVSSYNTSGNYVLTGTNGTLTITPLTSVKSPDNTIINLYPNPSSGSFQVESLEKIEHVKLFDALGHEETFYSSQINTQMKGMIVVLVHTDKGEYRSRIVIQ